MSHLCAVEERKRRGILRFTFPTHKRKCISKIFHTYLSSFTGQLHISPSYSSAELFRFTHCLLIPLQDVEETPGLQTLQSRS